MFLRARSRVDYAASRPRRGARDDAVAARVISARGAASPSRSVWVEHWPLYRVAYHVSGCNTFRVPSRHAFEWPFAEHTRRVALGLVRRACSRRRAAARTRGVFSSPCRSLAATLTGAYCSGQPRRARYQGMTKLTTLADRPTSG